MVINALGKIFIGTAVASTLLGGSSKNSGGGCMGCAAVIVFFGIAIAVFWIASLFF